MSTMILAHAQAMMAEAAVDNRSAQEDHADARLKQLDQRSEVQTKVLEETSEIQEDLDVDMAEAQSSKENPFLGKSRARKVEDATDAIAENQAVAGEAAQKDELLQGDEQAVFKEVQRANERVSQTLGSMAETLQALDKAQSKGALS